MRIQLMRRLAAASMGIAVLAGCSASAQQAGSFTAKVTVPGQNAVSLTGFAPSFSSDAKQAWYVQLVTPGGESGIMLLYSGAGRPPLGEHLIADFVASDATPPAGQFVAMGNVDPSLLSVPGLSSVGGKVVITGSSPTSIEGTFEYQARQSTGRMVVVEGKFESRNKEQ